MKKNSLLYLSRSDVKSAGVSVSEMIDALENAFREKGEGRVEMPPKPAVHYDTDSFIHAMPAYIPAMKAMGIKWVSGYPENYKRGLPYIAGLIVLNDPETGLPLSVMDGTLITALRTGAATALAAKYLARPESESMGILGAGVQGFSNLIALKVLFPLKKVTVYDVVPEKADEYKTRVLQTWPGMEVITAEEPKQAVVGQDIIVTAGPITKKPHATIKAGWVPEGGFASLVDFDSYWSRAALMEFDKFTTDDIPQLEYYRQAGYFKDIPAIYADLGELVTRKKAGRENQTEKTLACNLGLAISDMTVALLVYKRAMERGIGTILPL